MFINKSKLNKSDRETFDYYQNVTRFHRWLVNSLLILSWLSFIILLAFLIFVDMKTIQMWIYYPFWIMFIPSCFAIYCTTFWHCYLCSYRTVMIRKFQTNTKLGFIASFTYFVTKWFSFGWWLVKKYNYKKELKHFDTDFNL